MTASHQKLVPQQLLLQNRVLPLSAIFRWSLATGQRIYCENQYQRLTGYLHEEGRHHQMKQRLPPAPLMLLFHVPPLHLAVQPLSLNLLKVLMLRRKRRWLIWRTNALKERPPTLSRRGRGCFIQDIKSPIEYGQRVHYKKIHNFAVVNICSPDKLIRCPPTDLVNVLDLHV